MRGRGSPRQWIVPRSGLTKPQMALNSVVLPAPFGPITPSTSPRETWSDTSRSAVNPANRTVTPSTRNSAERSSLRSMVGTLGQPAAHLIVSSRRT